MLDIKLVTAVFLLTEYVLILNGEVLPYFNWDHTNPIFHKNFCGNGEYAHIYVNTYDMMNFVCPSALLPVSIGLHVVPQDRLFENFWMVTKSEFDNCEVNPTAQRSGKSRLLMQCDEQTSYKLKYYSFSFKPESGSRSAIVFQPNKTYYFMATSTGSLKSIRNRKGGRCKKDNMRVAITVCEGRTCTDCPNMCCIKPTQKPSTKAQTTIDTVPTVRKVAPKSTAKALKSTEGTARSTKLVLKKEETTVTLEPVYNSVLINKKVGKGDATVGRSHGEKEGKDLTDKFSNSWWFFFSLGVVCGITVVLVCVLLVVKIVQRRNRKNGQLPPADTDNCEVPSTDKLINLQDQALYSRLESTGSTGSGGDTPPSYPESPNGTLDSHKPLVGMVAHSHNGNIRNGKLPVISDRNDTCVQV